MIEIKEIFDESQWHPESVLPNFPFQQSYWYGEMQKARGRDVHRFAILKDGNAIGYAQFVAYPLFGSLKYWYAAYGPVIKDADEATLKELKSKLGSASAVFVRLDFSPQIGNTRGVLHKASRSSSQGSYFQPRHEWYTDISKSPEEILASMHQKTRYSVRYAEKKGITTEVISGDRMLEHLPQFLTLMKDTAKRNKFSLHDDGYYKCFFEALVKKENGLLVEAKLGEEILASHLVVVEAPPAGGVAHYVFGATSDGKKELCAPYLAHFAGMLEAKNMGAREYNFGGISEAGDSPHWEALTAFKKRFGGRVVFHSSYFDIIINPFWYYLYIIRKFFKSFV